MDTENQLKSAESTKNQPTSHKLKVAKRRRRVCELRCLGLKIPQIKEMLSKEGQNWSEDTIKRDLSSLQAQETLEELERQQLSDIAFAEDRKTKLEYRDRMIERLMPRKSPQTEVNVGLAQPKVTVEIFDHSKEPNAAGDQAEVQSESGAT
jgi:DNA-binding transcriptional MerR regulator